jgi:hypothetical protein
MQIGFNVITEQKAFELSPQKLCEIAAEAVVNI